MNSTNKHIPITCSIKDKYSIVSLDTYHITKNDIITTHIVKEILDDMVNSIVDTKEKEYNIHLIENKIIYFKNLIYKNLIVENDEHIQRYEFSRYVTICTLLRSFVTQLLSQKIEIPIRDKLKNMYYKIYKKSIYHAEFRKFIVLLRLNQIPFNKYISVKTVSLLDTMGRYMQLQLQFLDKLLTQKGLFYVINRYTLDDFICKIIFVCTLIIRFSSQ